MSVSADAQPERDGGVDEVKGPEEKVGLRDTVSERFAPEAGALVEGGDDGAADGEGGGGREGGGEEGDEAAVGHVWDHVASSFSGIRTQGGGGGKLGVE